MRKSLLVVLTLLFAFSATAQNKCVTVRGSAQEHLLDFLNPDWQGGYPGAPWVGPVQLILGESEVLLGKLSENDGVPGPSKGTGQARGGYYVFDFGTDGMFVVQNDNAIFPNLPKFRAVAGTGTFRAQGVVDTAVNSRSGRFAYATGNIMTSGDFVACNLSMVPPSGRFNNTITGFLCNVAPKE